LLLKHSTISLENGPLALSQFSNRGQCFFSLRATFFFGPVLNCIVLCAISRDIVHPASATDADRSVEILLLEDGS
jgi:hypothetical protein